MLEYCIGWSMKVSGDELPDYRSTGLLHLSGIVRLLR